MRSFTDLHAAKGYDKGLTVITALGTAGASMLVCMKGGARVVMVASLLGLLCMFSASAAPPEKPIPKALPVADDEPVKRTKGNEAPNAYTPFTRKQETKGSNSNRGKEISVDAANTPLGRYYRQVTGEVEKKWHVYLKLRRAGVNAGYLQLVFYVNKKGKVEGLKVINDKESTPLLAEITLQAIKDAEIPPMPADVIPLLPVEDRERLKIHYDALIY